MPLVASVVGPPNQLVPIPVPDIQSKAPLPFCHSQSGIDGAGPKSQKTSSMVTVGGGTVIVGNLINVKLRTAYEMQRFYVINVIIALYIYNYKMLCVNI